jgi:hypothetical protein
MADLERWGFNRSGFAERMADGYWTPWHIAQAAVAQAEERAAPPPDGASRKALALDVVEEIAREWDCCEFGAPGELIDIGDAIRRAGFAKVNAAIAAPAEVQKVEQLAVERTRAT